VKRFIRLKATQWVLSRLLSLYIDFTLWTMRWRIENQQIADDAVESPEGAVACFWHGRIALAVYCRGVLKTKPRKVLISMSRDGQFIADAVERLGFPAIRGSSERTAGEFGKGGASAFRESLKFMKDGGAIVVTPDGPRGPNEVMSEGPVTLARAGNVRAVMFGLAAHPALVTKGWDKGRLPLPFSRGCVVFDGPFYVPRDADAEAREQIRLEWQASLCAAQARAEAIVTGRAG
jgi:lysophospholipid acyltransferase (LPLAT)-like uncharacterized protein